MFVLILVPYDPAVKYLSWISNSAVDVLLQTSLHGSCPVVKGEKWVATKWIRDQKV
jgi:prolyl 4-hydroxylase